MGSIDASNPLRGTPADEQRYGHFETFEVTWAADHVLNISMNRPKVLNAQNPQMWEETKGVFDAASTDPDCRCVLLTGNGRLFTAGIDLQQSFVSDDVQTGESGGSKAPAAAPEDAERPDVARRALAQLRGIGATQALFNAIEECRVPVVAAIHRACLGAGVDMVCAADIRFCTADSTFAIKEVMLGLAADVGTLQRMPKVMGSESLLRELAFTGRDFTAEEAKEHGFVSRVFSSREEMCQRALETAQQIATNSPIAVIGTKNNLIYARDHSVEEGLKYEATWNMVMLQTEDLGKAAKAFMSKKPPRFSKL